jgi:Winged helix DNA-binding domain
LQPRALQAQRRDELPRNNSPWASSLLPSSLPKEPAGSLAAVSAAREAAFRLSRHHLKARVPRGSLVEVARQIGGLHAQLMSSADLSLWTRVRGHRPDDLPRALWDERTLVKTWLMRGTLHLVPADDLPIYAAALDSRGEYDGVWLRYYEVTARDMERLIEAIAESLDEPKSRAELAAAVKARLGARLAKRLESGWGEFLKPAARRGILCFGPSDGQTVTFVRPDAWLPRWREVEHEEAQTELLRRFLAAFGPATREDTEHWIGRSRKLRPAWELLSDELAEVEPKRFLLARDVEALERARPSRALRLLPAFDPYLIPKPPRVHLVSREQDRDRIYRPQAWITPVVLQGGRAIGVWPWKRRGAKIEVTVEPFRPLGQRTAATVRREARDLARYLGAELELTFAS